MTSPDGGWAKWQANAQARAASEAAMRQQPPNQVALAFRVFRDDNLAKVHEKFPNDQLSARLLGVVQLLVSDADFKDQSHSTLIRVRYPSAIAPLASPPASSTLHSPPLLAL
jgi:hypothetical protein